MQKHFEESWFWDGANFPQDCSALQFLRIGTKDLLSNSGRKSQLYGREHKSMWSHGFYNQQRHTELHHGRPATMTITSIQQKFVFL